MPPITDYLNSLASRETNSIDYLIATGQTVAIESAGATFIDGMKSSLSSFITAATTYLNGLKIGNYTPQTVIMGNLLKFIDEKGGYAGVRTKPISVPVGFEGLYSEYLPLILKLLPYVESTEDSLKQALAKVAQLLNEPDRMKAMSGIRALNDKVKVVSQAEFESLRAFYKPHQKSQAVFSAVYERIGDIEPAYKNINEINTRLAKVDFAEIDKLVNRLGDLSGEVGNMMQLDSYREVSATVATQLSELIYNLGMTVTLGSLIVHSVTDLSKCMVANIAEISG